MSEKRRLVCSAPDRETLQTMINEYLFSENWKIADDMRVYNDKTGKSIGIATVKRGRWRYEV